MNVISEKELEERYQISRKEFRAWLESKEENTIVGQSLVYGNDPIANALVELSKTSSSRKEDRWETALIDSETSTTTFDGWMKVENPRWIDRFIEKIDRDTSGDESINITAKQALEALTYGEDELKISIDIERIQEIQKAKELFSIDSCSISIGELLSLYKKKELIISTNSSYTSITQQNEFIESIFLDLPTQPLFVRQEEDGKWRTLAGGWMLKAIFHFLDENEKDRLVLRATELLHCLYGLTWNDLSDRERFQFKRHKFQVHILAENTEDRYLKDKVQSIFWRYSSYDY